MKRKPFCVVMAGSSETKVFGSCAFAGFGIRIPGWMLVNLSVMEGDRLKVRLMGGKKRIRLEVSRA